LKKDRLGRDALDVLATIKTLADLNAKFVVLQIGKLYLTSTTGKLMAMLAAVDEMESKRERDLIVERTRGRLARAKAEGKTPGRPAKTTPE